MITCNLKNAAPVPKCGRRSATRPLHRSTSRCQALPNRTAQSSYHIPEQQQEIRTITSSSSSPPVTSRRQMLTSLVAITTSASLLQTASSLPAASAKTVITDIDPAAKAGEFSVVTTAAGVRWSDRLRGGGDQPKPGDLVLVDLKGSLPDGTVFVDTAETGPLAFQLGTTNKVVTEGLSIALESMHGGGVRLVSVPAALAYQDKSIQLPLARVPPNADLRYEVSLLRCQKVPVGLACCTDADYPCIKDLTKPGDQTAGSNK